MSSYNYIKTILHNYYLKKERNINIQILPSKKESVPLQVTAEQITLSKKEELEKMGV